MEPKLFSSQCFKLSLRLIKAYLCLIFFVLGFRQISVVHATEPTENKVDQKAPDSVQLEAQASVSTAVSLPLLLKKSLGSELKKSEVESQIEMDWLSLMPVVSPWESQLNTSFEKMWSEEDSVGGGMSYGALNLMTRLNQKTPLGLSLDVSFENLYDLPDVNVFLFKERLSANFYLSLWNDLFGSTTRQILNSVESENKKIISDKSLLSSCERMVRASFDVYRQSENLKILETQLKNLERVQKLIGTKYISYQNELALKLESLNLKNRKQSVLKNLNLAKSNLSEILRTDLNNLPVLDFKQDVLKILDLSGKLKFSALEILKLEIDLLKSRQKIIKLSQGNDVSLYAGLRRTQTAPLNDNFESSVVGVNFKFNLNNIQAETSYKNLEAQIQNKKIQLESLELRKNDILKLFESQLVEQKIIIKDYEKHEKSAEEWIKLSERQFITGKLTLFEYLNSRNQTDQFFSQYVEAIINAYDVVLSYGFQTGDKDLTCFNIF